MKKFILRLLKKVYLALSLLFLVYLLWPGPQKVEDFPPLPESLKSDEPGDTVQVKDISAYYSPFFRQFVVEFYREKYAQISHFPFSPLRLNYPPEYAYEAIKDQTRSTYLEELVYPLKGSLFVNGFEPHYEDGTPKFIGATDIIVNGVEYKTKTTLRFYPAPIFIRLLVWLGINAAIIMIVRLGNKIL